MRAWLAALCLLVATATSTVALAEEPSAANRATEAGDRPAAPAAAALTGEDLLREALGSDEAHPDDEPSASAAEPPPPAMRIYGFADAGMQRHMVGENSAISRITASRADTFVLGNLNLYFDAQPSRTWAAMVEVRLTSLPHGVGPVCAVTENCGPTNSEYFDTTSASPYSKIKLNGLVLERAYVQWKHNDALTLRVGTFLTPFGIWNIDHGTPTLIALVLPSFEINQMFPLQQTGIELSGIRHFDTWEMAYYLYASNGRGNRHWDWTEDKMLGGRLVARLQFPSRIAIGFSGLTGRFVERSEEVVGFYASRWKDLINYRETVLGLDLAVDTGPWRFRSEAAFRRVDFQRGKREPFYKQASLLTSDHYEWNVYALVAYQLPFYGIEPFVFAEAYRYPTPLSDGEVAASGGLNIHFTSFAQLKAQYLYGQLTNFSGKNTQLQRDNFWHTYALRLVLAF